MVFSIIFHSETPRLGAAPVLNKSGALSPSVSSALPSRAAPAFDMLPKLVDRARPSQAQHRVRLDQLAQVHLGPIDVVIVKRDPVRGAPAADVTQNLGATREREPSVS